MQFYFLAQKLYAHYIVDICYLAHEIYWKYRYLIQGMPVVKQETIAYGIMHSIKPVNRVYVIEWKTKCLKKRRVVD